MVNKIKDFFSQLFKSRIAVLGVFMAVLTLVLIGRIFYLQIIKGNEYLENYTMKIKKERTLEGTRGNIYDNDGDLLAYNKLAYTVTFQDTGTYTTNDTLNTALYDIIQMVESNGDSIDNDFDIQLDENGDPEFTVSGSTLNRFLADIYGHSYISELEYNETLGYDESTATAQQVFDYLKSSKKFGISDDYSNEDALKLIVVRYAISLNSYQKYLSTTIASDVSDETVAKIEENKNDYSGLDIEEDTVRVYDSSEYFAQIIGYTGKISTDEYNDLSGDDSSYSLSDTVGKSGIEQYMESYLRGDNGSEELYVDNVGNVLEVADRVEPSAGDDVYLTIDKDLQITVYQLLEEELASILYEKIENVTNYEITEDTSASDIIIPINDVYFALINNNVLDLETFSDPDAGSTEQAVYAAYSAQEESVLSSINSEMTSDAPTVFNDCSEEMQDYQNHILDMLYDNGIVDKSSIDTTSDTYSAWKAGTISLKEYLEYIISSNNIDTSYLEMDSKYADLSEIYTALNTYIEDELLTDNDFHKLVYKYMIDNGTVTGTQICLMLFEQGALTDTGDEVSSLSSGSISAYTFIKEKIKNLEITPAQLALDPCNASCVMVDPNSGQVLACVTYPGYDNNKLANTVDSDYWNKLVNDLSNPQYNYATQQKTAPGSTFKPVTATAALTEGYLSSTSETVTDLGIFDKISDGPTCWIYPASTHGTINVSEAIRDSCNYFFYEMGWRMSTNSGTTSYNDEEGLSVLQKYAALYGLDSKTGIEISEATPEISDEDAVRSAIGQGTNNYTTTQLARYIATVANEGTCYNLSLISKVTDSSGNTVEEFSPTVYNELDEVSDSTWEAIHSGMEMVVQNLDTFSNFGVSVAGKTGTAQENKKRANHALFVAFAPSDAATVAIATRIPYGYTSANAAEVSSYILKYYFKLDGYSTVTEDLTNGAGTTYITD